ncbi:MAG: DMT family transporter [Candidatus Methanofastidiosum sp.]|nr:DMT family transporter [Methanofastidiosum sp.]NYT13163.1 DMT family transporter [Candidatus Methanofastidiosa archaeon]
MLIPYLALMGRIILLGWERILVKKLGQKSDSISGTFLFFGIGTIFLIPTLFFVDIVLNTSILLFVTLSSFVYSIAFMLYVKSLSEGEASLVSPLYNFNVFFLLILAVTFLEEKLTLFKILGLMFLFYGVSFLNRKSNILESFKAIFLDKSCQYMIGASLLIAIGRTIDGNAIRFASPLLYAFYLNVGISLFLLLYILTKSNISTTIKLFNEKRKVATLSGGLNAYSYLFLLIAFTGIEVSIAEPASMTAMIITVVLAGRILKENIKERLLGVAIMLIGLWMLFI